MLFFFNSLKKLELRENTCSLKKYLKINFKLIIIFLLSLLEERNTKGCTQCFCFGQTQQCRTSDLFVGSHRDMDASEWQLAYAIRNASVSDIKAARNEDFNLKFDDSNQAKLSEPIYWSASSSYLGNKVTSYGAAIKYNIQINAPSSNSGASGSGGGSTIRPDIILVGRDMNLMHTSIRQPAPNEPFSNQIDLLEGQFSHFDTGSSVTREQFMLVLSNLVEIKLRATYYNSLHESELINFEFDVGQSYDPVTANKAALSVEQCYCPPNYRGYSCESCEEGYYKVNCVIHFFVFFV